MDPTLRASADATIPPQPTGARGHRYGHHHDRDRRTDVDVRRASGAPSGPGARLGLHAGRAHRVPQPRGVPPGRGRLGGRRPRQHPRHVGQRRADHPDDPGRRHHDRPLRPDRRWRDRPGHPRRCSGGGPSRGAVHGGRRTSCGLGRDRAAVDSGRARHPRRRTRPPGADPLRGPPLRHSCAGPDRT
jgi:hypothetical protein